MKLDHSYSIYEYSDYFETELPEAWGEKRLSYLAKESRSAFVDGPFGSDLKTNDYKDAGVPLIQLNNIRNSKHLMQNLKFITEDKKHQLIRHLAVPRDVVIAKMADPVARAAIVCDKYREYIIVADCVKITPNHKLVDLNYLVWAINCDFVRIKAELVSTGTTRIRINLGELKNLKIPYPSRIEQQKIANFLDHEIAKIDTLIEKQQQLIKLLKEKRQAVISHAVTKGLNPDAPMKDSGLEWLGDVPAHWGVTKAKFVSEIFIPQRNKPTLNDSAGVAWVTMDNMKSAYIESTKQYIDDDAAKAAGSKTLRAGSVIASCVGNFGIASINKINVIINQQLQAFIPKYMNAEYLREIVSISKSYFELIGTAATLIYVNREGFENLPVLYFSIEEQKRIAEFLDQKTNAFAKLIENTETAIELMKERRTALISAAITGKIDVRNWQAPAISHSKKETNKEIVA
jgi:type I restriction enzyme, S subunit